MLARLAPIAFLLAACSDPAELPDAFHVAEVPGSVVATIDGGPCADFIGEGAHFYIVGGPDAYSLSLTQDPSQILCTRDGTTLTCERTNLEQTIVVAVDGDRAHVETFVDGPGASPFCQISMDATIEPI